MSMTSRGNTVVHIGLGKTATTFLQSGVFPLLEKHGIVDSYNDPQLLAATAKHHLVGLSDQEIFAFAARLQELGRVFLSDESLSAWNPAGWRAARDKNLRLFGPDTTVVITIREPLSYLTSVYLQYLQEGNVKVPSEFFIPEEVYERLEVILPRFCEAVFAIHEFDMSALVSMYREVYSSVVIVRMEEVFSLEFLQRIFHIDEPIMAQLRAASAGMSAQNVSYSATAVKMTFARERVLRALGLKSVGTTDFELTKLLVRARVPELCHAADCGWHYGRERSGPINFFIRRLKWTYLMQRIVDRIVPYRRYVLPTAVVPHNVLQRNLEYYESLSRASEARLPSGRT